MKRSGTDKKRLRRFMLAGVLIVLALLFSLQGFFTTMLGPLASPLVKAGSWISEKVFWWQERGAITTEELADLYDDRIELAQKASELDRLREENELLRDELGFLERSKMDAIAASILAKSISQSVSRFVINVGTDQGAVLGAAVVSGEGMYVGKITDIGRRSATVSALTDPNHSVAVSLLNESRTIGVASGSVGDLLQVNFIPTDEIVQENDLVVTSGLEEAIPSGLIVGIVNTVSQETGSPFQQAMVEPLTDVRRLSSVLVLTSTPSP